MSALEWLRSRAGKRVASGGVMLAIDYSAEERTTPPTVVIEIDNGVTDEQRRQFRETLQALRQPAVPIAVSGDALVACGCWPRYVGECRCGRS